MNVIYSLIVGYTFYKTIQSLQESPVTFEWEMAQLRTYQQLFSISFYHKINNIIPQIIKMGYIW